MEKNNIRNSIISGAISGSITAVTLQPLEYIKTKLQQPDVDTKISTINNKNRIRAIISYTLFKPEQSNLNVLNNMKKFWTGLTPSLMRSVPVAGMYFGLVEIFKNSKYLSHSKSGGTYEIVHSFLIGSLARTIADVSVHPLNLIKTRYESDMYHYKGVFSAFRSIFEKEGVYGLYKGLTATLIRDLTYSGIYFTLYTKIKRISTEKFQNSSNQSLYFASCALISSLLACFITQPPDVIRTNMQINQSQHQSFIKTSMNIYAKNGLKGFFAGFIPRSTRRTLISVMSWTIYERFTFKK